MASTQITIERVLVKDLKPSVYNPRKWDDKAISDMKESIARFGLCDPLIVNSAPERKNIVIGGHLRLKVATLLGFTEVPVVYLNIPDIEREKELNLRLNKNVGSWDEELLKAFDTNLLLDVGFTPDELNNFFDDVLDVTDDDFNTQEELAKIVVPETKPGDLYELGSHRLLCGNALDPTQIATLMGKDRAHMIFSDPPYNISLDYRKGIGTKGKYTTEKLVDDNKSVKEYETFLDDAIRNALAVSNPDTHVFFWCDEKYVGLLQRCYEKHGVQNRRLCLWVKNNFDPTPQVAFNKVIELCVYGTRGNPSLNATIKNLSEILNKEVNSIGLYDDIMSIVQLWLVKRDATTDYEHPTQKPITLCEKPIKRCSAPGEIILDLFGGSGSTLIAAEQLKRRAFLVELDPTFCDLIIRRFEHFTGNHAKRLN
ncbi:MAG: DNA modification methylase [Patescibacteria group bacterium]|nr:DNA modification methylase [Patescibacteria group bacterium]MDE2438126.1 DNA modification methylase [Patescibacteria group bacterium]